MAINLQDQFLQNDLTKVSIKRGPVILYHHLKRVYDIIVN